MHLGNYVFFNELKIQHNFGTGELSNTTLIRGVELNRYLILISKRACVLQRQSFRRLQFPDLLIIASWVRIHLGTGFATVAQPMLAPLTYMHTRDLKIYYLTITLYVHVHFRIVYFAPHYGELHVQL